MTTSLHEGFYKEYNTEKSETIVMIHGFRGTHHGLQKIAEQLPNYHLVVPDIPGFGEGETLSEYSLEAYVAWLREFMTSLQLSKPPFLLGHSFGSIITSAYAEKYPETIQKLLLVNPIGAPALEGPKAVMTKLAIFYYWLGAKMPRKIAQAWLGATPIVMIMSITMAKTKDRELRKYIHDQHRRYFRNFQSPQSVLESFKTTTNHSVLDSAAHIPVPTLLIAGDKDDVTSLDKQKYLQTVFPHASLHTITGVGHLTHYETPKTVAQLVEAFIASPDHK
jgi:pimeloyl-ACP methyl ester carboxylesterase